jgi:hypothetical protein
VCVCVCVVYAVWEGAGDGLGRAGEKISHDGGWVPMVKARELGKECLLSGIFRCFIELQPCCELLG